MCHYHLLKNIARRSSHGLAIVCLLLISTVSGCSKTPQEAVVGRWYNGDMSLRFRPNGTVVWNTEQGMAQGRYTLVGNVPRWATESATVSVRLDVVRNGQALQPILDLQFVGADRLRVNPTASPQTQTRRPGRMQTVLRRAASETETAANSSINATPNRTIAGVRGLQ